MKKCPICARDHKSKKSPVCSRCNMLYRKLTIKIKLVNFLGGKCSNNYCNVDDVRCLEFHHINPNEKSFQLCEKIRLYNYEALLEEAKKCKLLCSNCHRKFHHQDKQDILDYFSQPRINNPEQQVYRTNYKIRKVERPSKEVLAKEVFEYTAQRLAKKYSVSDRTIGKWCEWYNISKPSRGYWTQLKANNATYG